MANVSWGAPTLHFYKLSSNEAVAMPTDVGTNWASKTKYFSIPGDDLLENSATLSTSEGDQSSIKNEKGVDVDKKRKASSYAFSASIILKKGSGTSGTLANVNSKMEPENGLVDGNWAMCLEAEDAATYGFLFRNSTVTFSKSWSAEQGSLLVINVDGVEPNVSDDMTVREICDEYVKTA